MSTCGYTVIPYVVEADPLVDDDDTDYAALDSNDSQEDDDDDEYQEDASLDGDDLLQGEPVLDDWPDAGFGTPEDDLKEAAASHEQTAEPPENTTDNKNTVTAKPPGNTTDNKDSATAKPTGNTTDNKDSVTAKPTGITTDNKDSVTAKEAMAKPSTQPVLQKALAPEPSQAQRRDPDRVKVISEMKDRLQLLKQLCSQSEIVPIL